MCEEKKDYGKTLNLPQTEFPMRGNLPQREPDIQKEVLDNGLYETITEIIIDKSKCKKIKTASLTIYFAEANESIWNIAEKYNTTVDAIIRENNISDGIIDKKCKLLIPRM